MTTDIRIPNNVPKGERALRRRYAEYVKKRFEDCGDDYENLVSWTLFRAYHLKRDRGRIRE